MATMHPKPGPPEMRAGRQSFVQGTCQSPLRRTRHITARHTFMKQFFLFAVFIVPATAFAQAQPQSGGTRAGARVAGVKVIELWPEGVPDLRRDASEEKLVDGRVINV